MSLRGEGGIAGPSSMASLAEAATIIEPAKRQEANLKADGSERIIKTSKAKSRRITDIITDANGRPFFSLEFFPPKTQQGLSNLYMRIARMLADLDPAWVQITWGAGGSTQTTSLELAGRVQNGILGPKAALERANVFKDSDSVKTFASNVCLHLTCTNVEKDSLDQTLDRALALGIVNILALRGDPPRGQDSWVAADERFQHATDLVRYVKNRHGDSFCIGVAAYPELHPDAEKTTAEEELKHLKAKQDAGADFIVTQLFYDVDNFLTWYETCRNAGITIPVIPGVMPIQNYQTFRRITSLCKASVPKDVWDVIEPVRFDDAAVRTVGIKLATQMLQRICEESDIRGFHICTLNLEKSVKLILQALQWSADERQRLVDDAAAKSSSYSDGQVESASDPARLITPMKPDMSRALGEETAATWDEFPNGRYGDARSPAFGQIDGYGASLKIAPHDALKQWGTPVEAEDISEIFVRYLRGEIEVIPWCDCPILPETHCIRDELLKLNASPHSTQATDISSKPGKGWWTVGSQPSADGIDSSDPIFGFGPSHGYIFQKAFVEFFTSAGDMLSLESRIQQYNKDAGGPWLSYFAGNRAGELRTNVDADVGESCAVTWGCFAGKEIVQSTIIESESFKAWCEEAFAIWSEWELLFPINSATRKFLRAIGEQRWLVTVIHHDYKNPDALWKFLGVRS